MVNSRIDEESKRLDYIKNIFATESEALKTIGVDLPDNEKRMQIGADEGKLLYTLARMIAAKKIVEIGSLNGYSSIWLAEALPDNGKLYAFEKSKERVRICEENYKKCHLQDKIKIYQGEALANLKHLSEKESDFDLVFIDADKNNYCNYLDWAENNIRKGGIIIGDNTFLFGGVYGDLSRNPKAETIKIMNDFNKRLSDNSKYSSIMIPTLEGMTVAVKEF